jgi:hypothetical protein
MTQVPLFLVVQLGGPHIFLLHIIAPPALPDTNFDVEEDQRACLLML